MTADTSKEDIEKKETWNSQTKSIQKSSKIWSLNFKTICGEVSVDSPENEAKKEIAKVFYTAYLADEKTNRRPLIFFFNGGPGASSIWLHVGAFGPKRIDNLDVKAAQSSLIDNKETLLSEADLVFVDPIGTGFSSYKEETLKEFCTEQADAKYLAQFISKFLSQYKLWTRPLYLCGESYGGYRVSLLSHLLISKYNIGLNGIILIAPFLSGVSCEEANPNLIAEAHFLTSYIMSAWYHSRSSLNSTKLNEAAVYQRAKTFSYQDYLPARLQNPLPRLSPALLKSISELTGIAELTLKKEGLDVFIFSNHLFPGEKRYPGRLDARYTLSYPLSASPASYIDPSHIILSEKMIRIMNAYLVHDQGWEGSQTYLGISSKVSVAWRFEEPFFNSAFSALGAALKLQPKMQVYAAAGYYDLAVPAAAIEFDLQQMMESEDIKKRIHVESFSAGHMMYVQDLSRKKLTQSIRRMIKVTH